MKNAIENQMKKVEQAAQDAESATLLNAKTCAVTLGRETLVLLKLFAEKLGELENNETAS